VDASFKEINQMKSKTTGAIGGNDIQSNKTTNEGRISLFWFPHSNRPSTRVMTLAPFNKHQHRSPANDERLTGSPAKSSFVYKTIYYEYQDVACLL